eukprot:TRINITY_DN110009_c0_g1_i1.p1 TRINITY_DN110009_c0_g1~~TRINITY_DN110009_c0_g1_i1.p1  ORF type:complete len:362 (-),score=66.28 TRINITY_DN110009_c0_g1_i1:40-1083(-)
MGNSAATVQGDTSSPRSAFAVEEAGASGEALRAPFQGRRLIDAPRGGRSKSLLLGQAISLLITGTGVFSSSLASDGVSLPTAQSSLNYVLLAVHLFWDAPRLRRHGLSFPWWRYALWALTDVEANYLVVTAYRYTSVASVMLLDCFAIPCTMVFSRIALGASYTKGHIMACLVCVAGLGLTVLADGLSDSSEEALSEAASPLLGDFIVLAGATLYGLSNVQQEQLLKQQCSRCEVLGMLGLCGSIVSCVQTAAVEGRGLTEVAWSWQTVGLIFGFQMCLFGMYVLTSVFLQVADATLFNLSLLTSDVYSILYSWQVQHRQISKVYGVAFATTLSGLVLYHTQPPPVV